MGSYAYLSHFKKVYIIPFDFMRTVWWQLTDLLLPPENEVCEGYVFTPVCQSFCSQVGSLHPGGSPEGSASGGSASRGSASRGLHPGGSTSRGLGRPPIRCYGIQSMSRQYASYRNAFLFNTLFTLIFP